MEFHADEIAANIVGSKPMIDSMLRMDLSSSAFDNVVEHYNLKINESITTLNIFPNHVSVMNFLAKNNKVQFLNNLPLMATDSLDKFNKSKLIIKDQWASHPSLEERINAFEKLNIESINPDNRLANHLFKNITETQEKITKKLFQEVNYPQKPEIENENTFMETFHKNYFENKFPEIYNGYYVYLTTGSSKKYNLLFVKNKLEDMDYLEIELFNGLIGSLFLKDVEIKTQEYFKSKYPELFYV
jgi:hypothetical protein